MTITEVTQNKKQYLDLLLLADEQENMIDRYLQDGTMFVLYDDGIKAECIVLDVGNGILELKNIAVSPTEQKKGYGKKLIQFVMEKYKDNYKKLQVETDDCPSSLTFYQKCGFTLSHRVKNFFTYNYYHPIFEDGVQLVDMVY